MVDPVIELRASAGPGEIRIAAARDDTLLDFAIWRPNAPDGIGDVYRGRVVSVVPAMAGAFVTLGDAEGFLPDSEGAKGLSEGMIVAVGIARAAQGGKGPRLTAKVAPPPPEGPVGLVRRGPSPLVELAERYPDAPILVDDLSLAAQLRGPFGARVSVQTGVFGDALATAIDALEQAEVELPFGGRLSIYPTPALVAIDVDGGRMVAERRGKIDRHLAMNEAMLGAIAAQIRLRNLSGAIVVDLAGLSVKKRAALGPSFAAALADDPLRPRFLGFSALGLAEIVRARRRPPLHEVLAGPHAAGLAALRALCRDTGSGPATLRAEPAIVTALRRDSSAQEDFTRRTGRILMLRDDPSLMGWSLETPHEP